MELEHNFFIRHIIENDYYSITQFIYSYVGPINCKTLFTILCLIIVCGFRYGGSQNVLKNWYKDRHKLTLVQHTKHTNGTQTIPFGRHVVQSVYTIHRITNRRCLNTKTYLFIFGNSSSQPMRVNTISIHR